jgi:hypothetical protein
MRRNFIAAVTLMHKSAHSLLITDSRQLRTTHVKKQ